MIAMGQTKRRAKINMTAEELHAKYAFPRGARCQGCQTPQVYIRAITFAPFKDVVERFREFGFLTPELVMSMLIQLRGLDGKPRPYVRVGIAYSCKKCRKAFEKSLAKLPSWILVEINRGPKNRELLVQVTRDLK